MELIFKDKLEKKEILTLASREGCLPIQLLEKSFVMQGDNLIGLSKLLNTQKGFVDLVYIDPPFNTNQVFSISENRANAISRSKCSITAFEDLMDADEFLSFMYKRFVLLYELLSDKGSLYVHIDTKTGHYFKVLLDEIFGKQNYKNDITRIKSNPKNFARKAYGNEKDMILFYSKNHTNNIWNEVRMELSDEELNSKFTKIDKDGRRYTTIPLHAPGETSGITGQKWRDMYPPVGRHWRTSPEEFERLDSLGLIEWSSTGNPRIKKYSDEHKGKKIQDVWTFKDPQNPIYPTQKNIDMLKMIIKQSSVEGSYVMDCFAGSGTTLLAASELNRKFIGIDESAMAIDVIKSRLNLDNDQLIIL